MYPSTLDQEVQTMLNKENYAVIKSLKGRDVFLKDVTKELQ